MAAPQWQVERAREGHVFRWCDAEKICHQCVGHLVVLRPSDAVDEQVGQENSGEQCGGECAGANFQPPLLPLPELGGEVVQVGSGSEATVFLQRAAVADSDGGVGGANQQASPVRVADVPAPEGCFQPTVDAFEIRSRVGATSDAIGLPVGIQ